MTWKNRPNGHNTDAWLDIMWQEESDDGDDHWTQASVKFDGCIHFSQAGNVPFGKDYGYHGDSKERDKSACDGYFHICDLDDMIKKLQELKKKAVEHFGEGWELK